RVAVPRQGLQPRPGQLQDGVAEGDAAGFVDGLEVVEVDDDQGALVALALGQGQQGLKALGEQRPVGQGGEFVVVGEVFDAGLGGLLVGDVLLHRQVVGDGAVGLADGADDGGLDVFLAVLAAVVDFAPPAAPRRQVGPQGGVVLR